MYAIGLIVWCVIAIVLARALSRLIKSGWMRNIAFLVLVPVVFLLPLVDELIGKFQFDRLCDEAKDIKIFATIPVGEEFYFPDGRWRLSSSPPLEFIERNRVEAFYETLVRYESIELPVSVTTMPINGRETRVFNRKTGRLLASYRIYGTRGGLVSRGFEKPAIVRDQCLPLSFGSMDQRILLFKKLGGDK